jgi:pantoate--beta-alanine ligase
VAPEVINTVELMQAHAPGSRRAVVMTMGALHAGHAELMRIARERVGPTGELLVTVFVNPLQFGPGEDFERYPRTWRHDLDVCRQEGVDAVFVPVADDMYAQGRDITIDPGPLGGILEGAVRPGHFAGVLTVVAKLMNLTRPDVAVFGEKDYQQLVLIKRMVAQLNLRVEVVGAPTLREDDGLALSSRNGYLGESDRAAAAAIPAAISAAKRTASAGAGAGDVAAAATAVLAGRAGIVTDYVAVTDPELGPPPHQGPARILIAARVGTPRLLDNAAVVLGAS